MLKITRFLALAWLFELSWTKEVHLHWNITWVNAGPDGFQRPVIGINGKWPCPQVDVDIGDRLIVDVHNALGNQSTGIHWHGMHQFGSSEMDGANGVTQCPIQPGQHMRYDFRVNQTGTYWYHSHQMGQYPDGLRGPLIAHEKEPLAFTYDEELTVTVSDWYHEQTGQLLPSYLSHKPAEGGFEPLPKAALFNEETNAKIKVKPGKTYFVRIICVGNWPGHSVTIEDHPMTVVEIDGVWVEPHYLPPKLMRMAPGQRMGVLITTKNDTSRNYAVLDGMDVQEMFVHENRTVPPGFSPNGTAWLVYDEEKPLPPPPDIHVTDASVDFLNDLNLVPVEPQVLLEPVDRRIILNMTSIAVDGSAQYTINDGVYEEPETPTLYTLLSASRQDALEPSIYGPVNPLVVRYGEVIEVVINNYHSNLHAWHMHGHTFQVIQRTTTDGGYFEGYYNTVASTPIHRDTLMVEPHGHLVFRFKAANPGVWLLHCHTEFHVAARLSATFIEAPNRLQDITTIPEDHKRLCPRAAIKGL